MAERRFTRSDWERLGVAVQAARIRHGWADMRDWADVVERSPRLLLGLERGEQTGKSTLRTIENTLRWRAGYCDVILADPKADASPEIARPMRLVEVLVDEPRPLDGYTTQQLLDEIAARTAAAAVRLHTSERPTVTRRLDGLIEVVEPMSPQQQRDAADSGDR